MRWVREDTPVPKDVDNQKILDGETSREDKEKNKKRGVDTRTIVLMEGGGFMSSDFKSDNDCRKPANSSAKCPTALTVAVGGSGEEAEDEESAVVSLPPAACRSRAAVSGVHGST